MTISTPSISITNVLPIGATIEVVIVRCNG